MEKETEDVLYLSSDLAKEWSVSSEAVRKFVREIKADPDLMDQDLIRIEPKAIYITEAGRDWIQNRRYGRFKGQRPTVEDKAQRIRDLEAQLRQKTEEADELTAKVRKLEDRNEHQEVFINERIMFYEAHIKTLTDALHAQQVLTLRATEGQQTNAIETTKQQPTVDEPTKNRETTENQRKINPEPQDQQPQPKQHRWKLFRHFWKH